MVRLNHHQVVVVSVIFSIVSLCHAASNSHDDSSRSDQQQQTNLRRRNQIHGIPSDTEYDSPQLSDCLYSAVTSEDCAKKEGCVWCKEPVYGLCVTKDLADKMNSLPFFTCSDQELNIA